MWAIYLIATKDYFFDLKTHWNSELCGVVGLQYMYIVHVCGNLGSGLVRCPHFRVSLFIEVSSFQGVLINHFQ